MEHSFNIALAQEIGIPAAAILKTVVFWCRRNRGDQRSFHDGLWWMYNSIRDFETAFPYLTKRAISIALQNLVSRGYILQGNYNSTAYDRTKWYAATDLAYSAYPCAETENPFDKNVKWNTQTGEIDSPKTDSTESQNPLCENAKWKNQIGEMENANSENPFHETAQPIPDIVPDKETNRVPNRDNDQDAHSDARESEPAAAEGPDPSLTKSSKADKRFEAFWAEYPSKVAKGRAKRAFDKLRVDDKLLASILDGLARSKTQDKRFRDGYIPHPATWLNGKEWENEYDGSPPPVTPRPSPASGPQARETAFDALLALGQEERRAVPNWAREVVADGG